MGTNNTKNLPFLFPGSKGFKLTGKMLTSWCNSIHNLKHMMNSNILNVYMIICIAANGQITAYKFKYLKLTYRDTNNLCLQQDNIYAMKKITTKEA